MHGHFVVETAASLIVVSAGVFLVPAAWLAGRGAAARGITVASPTSSQTVRALLRLQSITAAALSLAAAIIHFAVAPEHASEYRPFGVAFIVVAIAQAAAAAAIIAVGVDRVRRPLIALTTGVLAVWIVSRTVGLPIGPEAWTPEDFGTTDAITAVLESGLILVLLVPIRRLLAAVPRMPTANALSVAVVPVIGTIGIATLVALSALGAGHH